MSSSLLLLVLMIFLWIGKLYNDEANLIKINGTNDLRRLNYSFYVFQNSNRSKSAFLEYVPVLDTYLSVDSIRKIKQTGRFKEITDSINLQREKSRMFYQRFDDNNYSNKSSSIISNQNFTSFSDGKSFVLNKLKPKFDSLIQKQYRQTTNLIEVKKIQDTLNLKGLLISNVIIAPTYETFAFELPNPRKVIYVKLMPQFLFAILVFICTFIAFTLIIMARRKQEQLTIIKNDFMGNMTHELKTPISTMTIALEAMGDFDDNDIEKRKEYLDISKKELKRLSNLVNKTLKMTFFDTNDLDVTLERLDMQKMIQNTVNSMNLFFEKKGGTCHYTSEGKIFEVLGDRLHIGNVVYNLIENALKYSITSPEVYITLTELNKKIEITVSDNGIGIPLEFQDKIFDKFFRIPKGNTHNQKGHGLGLFYVKGVIDKHSGHIKIKNTTSKGTTFIITLPKAL